VVFLGGGNLPGGSLPVLLLGGGDLPTVVLERCGRFGEEDSSSSTM
jgi:hypothetical protein